MNENPSPHLRYVLATVEQIAKFNTSFYKETMRIFLTNNKISKANISAFYDLLQPLTDNPWKFYNITSGVITLYKEKELSGEYQEIKATTGLNGYSLEEAGNLIKQIVVAVTTSGDEDDININESIEEFEDKFAVNGEYVDSKVIEFLSKSPIFETTENKFWQEFIRSIIKAEYLFDNQYSKKIKNTITVIENFFNPADRRIITSSFYLVKSFVRVSWLVLEFCESNRTFVTENEPQEQIVVNTDRRLRFFRIPNFLHISFDIGENNTRHWERLLESIVEMTAIDHRYIATNENIDTLLRLWGRLNFFDSTAVDKPLFTAIKIKTAELLRLILNTQKDGCNLVLNEEDDIETKIKNEAQKLTICDFVTNRDNRPCPNLEITKNAKTDIECYNNYVIGGILKYYKNTPLFPKDTTKPILKDIKVFLEKNKNITSQALIIALFKHIYQETSTQIKELNVREIEDRLNVLSQLEERLQDFIKIHKTNKFSSFRPLFEYSFYKIENDRLITTKIDDTDKTIFFASAGLPPIRIKWLEDQKIKFSNQKQDLYHKYDQLLSKKNTDEAKATFDDNIKDTQKNNITILGILAGMLMFVTSSAQFFKNNSTIQEYFLFALIFVTSLSVFAVTIKIIFNTEKKQEKTKNWINRIYKFIVVSVLLLLVALCFFNVDFGKNKTEQIAPKQNIEQSGTTLTNEQDTILINSPLQ
jgi:hypothetical protein